MKFFFGAYVVGHASFGRCQDVLRGSSSSSANDAVSKSGDQYTSKFIGNSAHFGSGDYQQYVDQYAGAYRTQNKGSSSHQAAGAEKSNTPGPDSYQTYMNQYAKGYAGAGPSQQAAGSAQQTGAGASGQGAGYQQYMKQYAASYSGVGDSAGRSAKMVSLMNQTAGDYLGAMAAQGGGASSFPGGGSYQQYVDQYARDYMGGTSAKGGGASASWADYQHYQNQYAGGGASPSSARASPSAAGPVELVGMDSGAAKSVGSNGAEAPSGKPDGAYQQYMKQYAGSYMGGGAQSTAADASASPAGAQSGSGYQQFTADFAAPYMNQFSKSGGGSSSQGGDYQQYMKTYAGSYMKQGNQPSGTSQKKGSSTSSQSPGDYQKYLDQYGGDFVKQYAGKYMNQKGAKQGQGPQGPARAEACNTTEELDAWKAAQDSQLEYIPADYQMYPKQRIEAEYKTNYERITGHAVPSKAEQKIDRAYDKLLDDAQATAPAKEETDEKADQADEKEENLQKVLQELPAEKVTAQKQPDNSGRASDDAPKERKESVPTRSQGGEGESKSEDLMSQQHGTRSASELAEVVAPDTQSLRNTRFLSAVGCGLLSMSLVAFVYRRSFVRNKAEHNTVGRYVQRPPSEP